jgi:hypothetical protein
MGFRVVRQPADEQHGDFIVGNAQSKPLGNAFFWCGRAVFVRVDS